MNVLPQAIANGRNQNGTIAGKLKGTIAAQTPTGWRTVSASTLRDDVLEDPPLHRGRDGARRLDHLDHAGHLGARVADRLAHLGGHRAARAPRAGRRGPRAARTARRPRSITLTARHCGQRRARGGHGGVQVGRARERHPGEHLAGGGVGHVERAPPTWPASSRRRRSCPARATPASPPPIRTRGHVRSRLAEQVLLAGPPQRRRAGPVLAPSRSARARAPARRAGASPWRAPGRRRRPRRPRPRSRSRAASRPYGVGAPGSSRRAPVRPGRPDRHVGLPEPPGAPEGVGHQHGRPHAERGGDPGPQRAAPRRRGPRAAATSSPGRRVGAGPRRRSRTRSRGGSRR